MAISGTQKVHNFRVKRRRELIAVAGGACIQCGYDKCEAALVFHHRDPATKTLKLTRCGVQTTMERCLEELEKCDLLCSNCHAEVHEEMNEKKRKAA